MKITLRQIEAFQAVTELSSFSRAAERLGTSQPALSQVIRDLETALGARLFDRTTRRVDLTEAGSAFAAQALAGLEEIGRAVEQVQDLSLLRRGTVRVAAPPLLAATALPQALRKIAAAHPGIEVKITDLGTDAITEHVRNGQADLGLGTFPPGADGFDSMPVLRDELMVFVPRDAEHGPLTWSGLSKLDLITLTRESGIRLLTEVGFETAQVPLRPRHEVHQIGTALALVAGSLGCAVLPAYARAAVGERPIRAVPLTDPVIAREITLITARDRAASAATVAVRGTIRQVLRAMGD
ncbi:LysR family transcriptional regulator [Lutimaribacter saemankumensis]|uniref:DNA-binding transcriptional regulator, LysR family n=1 Tax=Lutimaribacter saemankumensis TaxID=490829 RepID=A0A1G8K0T5_9RHOB|nr:LysR family transcriptional regulator [Lutimaribacter saemankumensis]SDI36420.1 DNA-binding transcriptional regulator, LysR family [Lutimaribacter saemankumensis]